MNTVNGIIIFFVLIAEGALTRLAFTATGLLKRKIKQKVFSAVTDVFTAIIGAGIMLLTCLLATENVRVFYAVFYLGGMVLCHLLLPRKLREIEKAADDVLTRKSDGKPTVPDVRSDTAALPAGASANSIALPAPGSALRETQTEKPKRRFRLFFGKNDTDDGQKENAAKRFPFFRKKKNDAERKDD